MGDAKSKWDRQNGRKRQGAKRDVLVRKKKNAAGRVC